MRVPVSIFLHPITLNPLSITCASKILFTAFIPAMACGKKTIPVPYEPIGPKVYEKIDILFTLIYHCYISYCIVHT